MGDFLLGLLISIGIGIIAIVIILLVANKKKNSTAVTAISSSTSQPNPVTATPAPQKGWLVTIIGILITILSIAIIIFLFFFIKGLFTPSPQVPSPQIQVLPTLHVNMYNIPLDGLRVYLHPGWKDFPKLGAIIIVTPNGTKLKDKPGEINHFGYQPEGWYTIYRDPIKSERLVQILDTW